MGADHQVRHHGFHIGHGMRRAFEALGHLGCRNAALQVHPAALDGDPYAAPLQAWHGIQGLAHFRRDRLVVAVGVAVLAAAGEPATRAALQATVHLLSHLCRHVFTVERWRELQKAADRRFAKLGIPNVTTIIGDGWIGWPPQAPYDRIIVTAAAETIPQVLVDELAGGGIMVLPLGEHSGPQRIVKLTRGEGGVTQQELIGVRFVPLLPGQAREL